MVKITYGPLRQSRRLLFIISWAVFLYSLLTPASPQHTISMQGGTPVLLLVIGGLVAIVPTRVSVLPGSCIGWSTLAFAAMPLVTYSTVRWPRWMRLVYLSPPLLVWVPPMLVGCAEILGVRGASAYRLLWGYYVLASAYTLSYLAAQISPAASPRAGRHRGFPVIIDKPSGTDENRAGGPEQEGRA